MIEAPCGIQGQQFSGVDVGDHVGDLKADALELADLLAELFTFCGVVQGIVKAASCAPDRKGGDGQACGIEPFVHYRKAAIDFTQDLGIGQAAVVKIEDAVLVAPVGD